MLTAIVLSLCSLVTDTAATRQMRPVDVVETARTRALRAAVPVHVLERDEMRQMGITGFADALHHLPSVTLRDYGGAGGMKTVSVRGLGTKHTGVAVDGLMLSDALSGEIDLGRYSLADVERLSLSIGDADDIFVPARTAAQPAVLFMNSLAQPLPGWQPRVSADVRAGSYGYVSPHLTVQQPLGDRLTLGATGSYTHADNGYPFTFRNVSLVTREHRRNSRMDAAHGELSALWQPSVSQTLTAKVYAYGADRQLPGQVYYYSQLSRETLSERNVYAQAAWTQRLGRRLTMRAAAKWDWAASDYADPLYPSHVRDAAYWQRDYYATLSALATASSHWSVSYAADYAVHNLNSTLPQDRRPQRNSLWQTAAVKWHSHHATATVRLLHSLHSNRARTGSDARSISHLSPSIGVSVQPWGRTGLSLHASYKDIFRPPTFTESYYFHYGSTDLKPECTSMFNAGFTYTGTPLPRTTLTLTADAYSGHVSDKIQAVPYNMFIFRCINLGRVRTRGIDATLQAACDAGRGHSVRIMANYTLQEATNRTLATSPYYGLQIAYTPLHIGAVSVAWLSPWVQLTAGGQGCGERYSSNEHHDGTRLPPYWEWTLTAARQLRLRRCTATLRAECRNVLNRQYDIIRLYPMPGRHYFLTLSLNTL